MFKKLSKKKGFTLIEMMIVVAIIAILIAIIVPTFKGALDRANAVADEANLRAYYAEVMADAILNNKDVSAPSATDKGGTITVSGVQYKLHGSATYSVDSAHNQLVITYTAPDGRAITIPGAATKTTTGGGTGSNP